MKRRLAQARALLLVVTALFALGWSLSRAVPGARSGLSSARRATEDFEAGWRGRTPLSLHVDGGGRFFALAHTYAAPHALTGAECAAAGAALRRAWPLNVLSTPAGALPEDVAGALAAALAPLAQQTPAGERHLVALALALGDFAAQRRATDLTVELRRRQRDRDRGSGRAHAALAWAAGATRCLAPCGGAGRCDRPEGARTPHAHPAPGLLVGDAAAVRKVLLAAQAQLKLGVCTAAAGVHASDAVAAAIAVAHARGELPHLRIDQDGALLGAAFAGGGAGGGLLAQLSSRRAERRGDFAWNASSGVWELAASAAVPFALHSGEGEPERALPLLSPLVAVDEGARDRGDRAPLPTLGQLEFAFLPLDGALTALSAHCPRFAHVEMPHQL